MLKRIVVLLFFAQVTFSQHYGNNVDALKLCSVIQTNNFTTNIDAERGLQRILSVIGASKRFVLQPCNNINNAVATSYKGIRYILYDKDFMDSLDAGDNWSNLFILAHEVGHHINGHSLDLVLYAAEVVEPQSLVTKREEELEADEFAGFILAKLGAPFSSIELLLNNISLDYDDTYSTHPSLSKRINAARKGFLNGSNSLSETSSNNENKDENNFDFQNLIYQSYYDYNRLAEDLNKVAKLVNKAIDLNKKGKFLSAAPLLTEAYQYGGELQYIYYAAASYVNGKDYRNALKAYSFLVVNNYNEENRIKEITKNIGLIFVQLGYDEEAISAIKFAQQINPNDVDLILNEADIYMRMSNNSADLSKRNVYRNKFKQIMELAISLDPTNNILYYNLGVIYAENNDIEMAQYYYEKSIELNPNYIAAYLNLVSSILSEEGDIIKEMNSLGTTRQDNERYDYLNKMRKELYVKCIPLLEKVRQLDPSNQDAISTLKSIYNSLSN